MPSLPESGHRPLRIVHVLRAPLGGLYRHVLDLAREQARRGHAVGLIADSSTGGEAAQASLAALSPSLALGLSRVPMRRNPHPSDLGVLAHVISRTRALRPDVLHGHGSKGGVFARLPGFLPSGPKAVRAYTPHGGSLNHRPGTTINRLYMSIEALLARRTDALLFESAFIGTRYRALVGEPAGFARVVHNGIAEAEFETIPLVENAAEFLYVGELRAAKGIDVMLAAIAAVKARRPGRVRAVLVGTGPDRQALEELARTLGIGDAITFAGGMPAREAFARGRILVMPSRAESLPYVALEATAARIPMIATDVGGIPEIFGPYRDRLIPSDDVGRLAGAMEAMLDLSPERRMQDAEDLARFVHEGFSITAMVDDVIAAYRDALSGGSSRAAPRGRSNVLLSSGSNP